MMKANDNSYMSEPISCLKVNKFKDNDTKLNLNQKLLQTIVK